MINDFSEGFVKCGHAMLYYRSYGDGVPLIMLHGNMQSAKLFHKQLVFFTDTCRVITIDSRGHGKSSHGVFIGETWGFLPYIILQTKTSQPLPKSCLPIYTKI